MPKHLLKQLTSIFLLFLATVVVHGQSDVRTADVEMIKQLEKLAYEPERLTAAEAYLTTRPPGDSSLTLASLIHDYAVLAGNGGKFSKSLASVDEEIRLRQNPITLKDSILFARALNLRSTLLDDFGQTEQSKTMNAKAMKFIFPLVAQGKPDAYDQYSRILKSRVLTAVNELDYELANQLIIRIKAIPSAARPGNVNDFLPLYDAYVAAFLGDHQKVVDLYSSFIEERTDRRNTSYYGFALLSLGEAYFQQGDNKRAKAYYARSLNSFKSRCGTKYGRAYDCREVIGVYASQIEVHAKEGDFDQTDMIYQLARKEIEKGLVNSEDYVLSSLHLQAAIAKSLAYSPQQAEKRFTHSLSYLTDKATPQGPALLPTIRNSRLPEKLRLREWLLAKFEHYARQTEPEVRDLAFLVHQKLDSLLYYAGEEATMTAPQFTNNLEIRKHYEAVLELADERHRQGDGNSRYRELAFRTIAATKGNALRRRLDGERIAAAAGLPPAKLRVRENLQVNVAILRSRLPNAAPTEQESVRDSLIQLTYQLTALDEQLKGDYPLFKQALERPAIPHSDDFRKSLPPDQAVVDYFVGFSHIHATVTSRNHPLRYYSILRPPKMEGLIGSMLTSPTAAGRLHDVLIAPILIDLPPEINRLQFIPDDILWQIPFAALMNGRKFLIEDYAVSTAYSIQSLYRSLNHEVVTGVQPYVGFASNYASLGLPANPLAVRGVKFSALPLAPREVNDGAKLMNGKAFINESATKEAFLQHYRQRTIIHCALHGVLDEADPFLSSLVFQLDDKGEAVADYLPLSEILGLPGLGQSQLVILSSCHSDSGGLQPGEGINSVARGFRLAGVRAVLASRWEVNDDTGFQLIKLYQEYLREGMTLDHALRSATLTYLQTAPTQYATPYHWAGLASLGGQQVLSEFTSQQSGQWSLGLIATAGTVVIGLFLFLLKKQSRLLARDGK